MISGYPNAKPTDERGYVGAIASVLIEYPRMVATKCTSPVHGVARELKFLPTVAEVVAWCERSASEMRQPVVREDRDDSNRELLDSMPEAPLPPRISATYSALCQRYGISSIPGGWDAVDLAKAAAKHGSALPEIIEKANKDGINPSKSVFSSVIEKAKSTNRARMDAQINSELGDPDFGDPPF